MNSNQERTKFSERLQQALQNAEYSADSPTQLAREFNLRFSGNPVTVHAARKWLQAESIPTQEKLRALASWLNVPAEWLRFGSGSNTNEDGTEHAPLARDARILSNLQQLNDYQRNLVHEFIRLLIRMERKK
jgi:transcriptional regulator with XRE-family HTH domain